MKLIKSLTLAFIAIFALQTIQAQQEVTEGYIKMKITEVSSDDEQTEAMLQMMVGTVTEYYFNTKQALVKADVMGGMVKMTNLTKVADQSSILLMDMMGNKMMVESTKEEREAIQSGQSDLMSELEITIDENDTKEILGQTCVKATVNHPEKPEGISFDMYIAPNLALSNQVVQGMEQLNLGGFPLEYNFSTGQMTLKIEAEDLKLSVDDKVFDLSTTGYKKMTMEEFAETMGSMGGGGMGF